MIARLGVLGGMFDPVHIGHISAACYAIDCLDVTVLKMVPCATPNHREQSLASAEHRLQMLKLATAGYPAITVDPIEINRAGISFTVDTLSSIRLSGEAESLVFVLGLDAFNSLPQWHDWRRILELCHLLVLARSAARVSAEVADLTELTERQVESADEMFAQAHGKVLIAEDFSQDVSSRAVRDILKSGGNAEHHLDSNVHRYIIEHELYGY